MPTQRILWYFADPMCSWCWGFAPVISAIKEAYSDRVKIALMLGGLRPGTTEPMALKSREEILHHWQDVHRMTGQPFTFEGAMPEGFVYDTEPPSRAVIAVADINSEAIFPYFKSVQEAFYALGRNVTQPETLAELAEQHNIERTVFLDRFRSDEMQKKTQTHFQIARESGVRGFPTVVLQDGATGTLLTNGYRPFDELQPAIDQWLSQPERQDE
ncbi:MAG: DsbA family protein [Sulfuricaulis sp.]|uniref:DsbA family protein n=1 Tax=Sulfuricaulis sp. TaxID=2003553 RepID=UPI0025E07DDB|nr:DsbA family protein [Sulfuricaulis sp.]MCR4347572.1 DsbA family protein [Sulfuricaulis sp.]